MDAAPTESILRNNLNAVAGLRFNAPFDQVINVWSVLPFLFGLTHSLLKNSGRIEVSSDSSTQAVATPLSNFHIEACDALTLSADEPMVAPARACFAIDYPDQTVKFLTRIVTYNQGDREIWIQVEGEKPALRLFGLNPDAEIDDVIKHFQDQGWSRWIYLDSNLELCRDKESIVHRIIIVKGSGIYWRKEGRASYEFQLRGVPEGLRWGEYISTLSIVPLVQDQLKDAESSCFFAFRWSNLTDHERNHWLYKTKNETFAECERILSLFMCSGDWWHKEEELVCIMDELPWEKDPHKTAPNPLQNSNVRSWNNENGWIQTSRSQRRLLSVIDQHFGIYYDEKCRQHQQYGRERQHCWYLRVKPPTYHERLEARLELRDWLRGKVAPEEVPFLLGDAT